MTRITVKMSIAYEPNAEPGSPTPEAFTPFYYAVAVADERAHELPAGADRDEFLVRAALKSLVTKKAEIVDEALKAVSK